MSLTIISSSSKLSTTTLTPSATAAVLQAEIDRVSTRGGAIELEEGDYFLDSPIVHKSNVLVTGYRGRRFRLRPGPNWSGGADDATNALWKIRGALNTTTLNSTLSATVDAGATQITVGAVGTLQPGDWIWIEGRNGITMYPNSVDGTYVVRREPAKVASNYTPGSTTIPLAWPLLQSHATGLSVKGLDPVVNTGLGDVDVYAPGGSLAVGVLVEYMSGTVIENPAGEGCSRALVDAIGMHDFRLSHGLSHGELNSLFLLESVLAGRVSCVACDLTGARSHASGVTRALVHMRFACTDVTLDGLNLRHGVVGLYISGPKHVKVLDANISDMVADRAVTTWDTAGEGGGASQRIGVGMHIGSTAVANYGEWGHDLHLGNIQIHDVTHATSAVSFSAYLNDTDQYHIDSLSIIQAATTGGVNGLNLSDCKGVIDNLEVTGVSLGLHTENITIQCRVGSYAFHASPWETSASPNGNYALKLGHAIGGLQIDHFEEYNCAFPVWFLAGAYNDPAFRIGHYYDDANHHYDCHIAYNDTGVNFATGDVVAISGEKSVTVGSYTRTHPKVITPTGAAGEMLAVVVVGSPYGYGTGFLLVSHGPVVTATVKAADVIAPGDILETTGTTRELQLNAASTRPFGCARTSKTGTGAAAKVQVVRF